MAAETAHKTPGCPLGARDSWPAALTGAEGDVCQPGAETKAARPAASPRSRAHTQEDAVPTALREERPKGFRNKMCLGAGLQELSSLNTETSSCRQRGTSRVMLV